MSEVEGLWSGNLCNLCQIFYSHPPPRYVPPQPPPNSYLPAKCNSTSSNIEVAIAAIPLSLSFLMAAISSSISPNHNLSISNRGFPPNYCLPKPISGNSLFLRNNFISVHPLSLSRRSVESTRMCVRVSASSTAILEEEGLTTEIVEVDLGDRSYPIYIGSGLLHQPDLLRG